MSQHGNIDRCHFSWDMFLQFFNIGDWSLINTIFKAWTKKKTSGIKSGLRGGYIPAEINFLLKKFHCAVHGMWTSTVLLKIHPLVSV